MGAARYVRGQKGSLRLVDSLTLKIFPAQWFPRFFWRGTYVFFFFFVLLLAININSRSSDCLGLQKCRQLIPSILPESRIHAAPANHPARCLMNTSAQKSPSLVFFPNLLASEKPHAGNLVSIGQARGEAADMNTINFSRTLSLCQIRSRQALRLNLRVQATTRK